ncbi:Rrf2 family transcriptional regulator [uncultured Tyzzerella sp.]|uniref:RrF2 family transcriptional regulator n=1 Tax=uncultured Tyzzerella sp. TaxID=2321398 RepID=UPI00294338A5|nr:Rrf2 family transcriptional regulator [uncultured Tyzzerella sp.]
MKISTRGRYGIKAMVDLAMNSKDDKCISLKSIAQRQGIPENYLEQLMAVLKKAEVVKSVRGAQGGYVLNRNPEDISVGDLLKILEGSLALVDCLENQPPKKRCGDANCNECVVKDAWEVISDKLAEAAHSISLKDLIKDE